MMKITAKDSVVNLKPYVNGSHSEEILKNHKKILKLDSNESTVPPSPRVLMALSHHIQEGPLNWYPDVESSMLRRKLADYVNLPSENIMTFNGSDHALKIITRVFLNPGDEAIIFHPTYDHFRVYVETSDAKIVPVREALNVSFKDKVLKGLSDKTKIVYLVNPNNPTGFLTPQTEIEEAVSSYKNILFIVDEAYFEFCGESSAQLVKKYHNIVVTRSFSKAFGMASLRCGYLLACEDICHEIGKVRIGKNINALAQVAAFHALDDLEYMYHFVEEVKTAKAWISQYMREMGLVVRDTPANYLLVKVAQPKKVLDCLKEENILIRDRSQLSDLEGFVRLTVGDQFTMKRFWRVFSKIPKEFLVGSVDGAQNEEKMY